MSTWDGPTWQPGPELEQAIARARQDGRRKSPNGTCHTCGKRVVGERRFCGLCAARRSK